MAQTSQRMREDPLFMRNSFECRGKYGLPLVKKQRIDMENVSLIAWSNTKVHDSAANRKKGVHFFVDDYRFNSIYAHPEKSYAKLSQYAFLLTPDYSTYADMNPWRQIESVAHSRWCGAYWQNRGQIVVPTITWSTPGSYAYCFDGIEQHSIVAIGMIGSKRDNRLAFLRGYYKMLEVIQPEAVICFGRPFAEMDGHLIVVDYHYAGREER